jgi:hypothetical protein
VIKWLIRHKNVVTNYCGLLGGIGTAFLLTIHTFGLSVPQWVNILSLICTAVSIGLIGWYSGKNPADMFPVNLPLKNNNEQFD